MKSKRFSNRVYRKYHQSRIGKNNRHGKVSDEFIKITLEETDDCLCKFDGICPYCKGVVDYSIPGGVSSISSDRIKSGLEPYSVKNIRFCHLSCNLYERSVRGKEFITSESYKKRLTDYWGCDYISPDSVEGVELLKRNRLYLLGTKSYQINLEKSAVVVKITNKKITNKKITNKKMNTYNVFDIVDKDGRHGLSVISDASARDVAEVIGFLKGVQISGVKSNASSISRSKSKTLTSKVVEHFLKTKKVGDKFRTTSVAKEYFCKSDITERDRHSMYAVLTALKNWKKAKFANIELENNDGEFKILKMEDLRNAHVVDTPK